MPNKQEKILSGLRSLCDRQRPGETFSAAEIAAACDCSTRNILFIEEKAKTRLKLRMRAILKEHGLRWEELCS